MARPKASGYIWRRMFTDMANDAKIKRAVRLCAEKTGHGSIAVSLYNEIVNRAAGRDGTGYSYQWIDEDDATMEDLIDSLREPETDIKTALDILFRVQLLDKEVFDNHKVLTSHGIQSEHIYRCKRRTDSEIDETVSLFDEIRNKDNLVSVAETPVSVAETPVSVAETPVSVAETPVSVPESTQDKDKDKDIDKDNPPYPPLGEATAEHSAGKFSEPDSPCKDSMITPTDVGVKAVLGLFADICGDSLGRPIRVTTGRRKAIKARLADLQREGKTFAEFFELVYQSDFLCGRNDRGWKADFDWVLKEANFTKILEGRYENARQRGRDSPGRPSMHVDSERDYGDFWETGKNGNAKR